MNDIKLYKGNIDLYSLTNTSLQTFCIGVCIKAGSNYETRDTNGYAHLFEHTVFRNIKNSFGPEFYNLLAKNSVEFFGTTYKEAIIFKIYGLKSGFDFACEVLNKLFSEINISRKELEAEKGRIKAEIREKDKRNTFRFGCDEARWKGTSLSQLVIGYCKNIDNASVKALKEYQESILTENNVFAVTTGNLSQKDIQKINDILNTIKLGKGEARNNSFPEPQGFMKRNPEIVLKNGYWTSVFFSFDHRCGKNEKEIIDIIYEALFTGDSGIVYRRISEDAPLVYSYDTFNERYLNCGTVTLEYEVDSKNLEKSLAETVKCFNMIKDGDFDFELCQKKYEYSSRLCLDDSYALCTNLAFDILIAGDNPTEFIKQDIENHKAIKKQDVVEYAKKFFVTDNLVLGIEGNKRKLEKRIDIIKSIISELN